MQSPAPGGTTPGTNTGWGATELESSSAAKDLEVPLDTRLNMSHKHPLVAKTGNGIFSYIRQSIANRRKEMILPLYSALMRPHLECWFQLWAP